MLRYLYIENFALVDRLEINFESGMNVLTGETGAGKSIIVGAIARLLGERADKEDIRSGERLAVVEGEFEVEGLPEIEDALDRLGIITGDNQLTLRKEISLNKASRSFINGRIVTLTQLRDITGHLAELFGQHSHQQLLDEKNHQSFLDRFAGLIDDVNELKQLYHDWQNAKQQLTRLESRREIEKNERELFLFQKEEIEKAKVRIGEEEELFAEKKILDSSKILGDKASLIMSMLDGDNNAALHMLAACRKELATMTALDKKLERNTELLEQSIINLEELRSEIEAYLSSIPDDPERLDEINLRLDELYRLKKKYGGSEQSILETLEKINEQLGTKMDIDGRIRLLEGEQKLFFDRYSRLAVELHRKRKDSSARLTEIVVKELREVGIDSARFEYEFIYEMDSDGIEIDGQRVRPNPQGLETGRFLVSANPGEPLKPLAKTASGGEISRIMLALKAADKRKSEKYKNLLVFDEIDAGIGGNTANMVAKRLADLSRISQVLVITHLHQIASASDNHFAVEKVASKLKSKRRIISVRRLNKEEKEEEIRRMLSLPEEAGV